MEGSINIFDRTAVRRHRDRAAAAFAEHDFLFREIGERLADRLDDITLRFPLAAEIGARNGLLRAIVGQRGGIERLVEAGLSAVMLDRTAGSHVVTDEELLPFADASLDLVISNLALHWVNDLPGCLSQVRRALKPDGLFLAALFGGETLHELGQALGEAEIAATGGMTPRISPFVDVRDAGALLQRAGFALPVVDSDRLTVSYPDALALMRDLRHMGETNAAVERTRTVTRRDVLLGAAAAYQARCADAEGRIPATFQVIYLTAWRPHDSQQKPARRGSGQISLADVLGEDGQA
jgi:SAM-dependent methyltransferase